LLGFGSRSTQLARLIPPQRRGIRTREPLTFARHFIGYNS
jgi:hypothetical protein